MTEHKKVVRDKLNENGCPSVCCNKSDHDIWYSSTTKRYITVDGKIKSRHTANAIMKQIGISFRFRQIYISKQPSVGMPPRRAIFLW